MIDRTGFIGGSDAAAIIGVSPWRTPYQLWEEKVGQADSGSEDAARERVLRRGKRLEPVVMEMLQDEYDIVVAARNHVHFDAWHSFLRAEVDFEYVISWTPDNEPDLIGNGDVKTVHPYHAKDWGEEGTDEVPAYYVAQFQFGMMVTGRSVCCVAALIGADDLRVYYVHRDEEIIAMLRERCVAFWENHVLLGVAPPVTTAEDAARAIRRFNGVSVKATEDVRAAIVTAKELKASIKILEARLESAETIIKCTLAAAVDEPTDNKFAIVDEVGRPLCTWNPQSTTAISDGLVKSLHPEIVAEVTKTNTFRVLRLK